MASSALKNLMAKKTAGATVAPVKKLVLGKKPAPATTADDDGEEEGEEEVVAAPAKKVIGKPVVKKAAAPVEEEEEEGAEEGEEEGAEEGAEEDAEEEVVAPAKKVIGKKPAPAAPAKKVIGKAPVATAKKPAAAAAEEKPARGLFGSAAKKAAPRKVPTQGGMITREEALRMFAEKHNVGQAQAKDALEKFEEFYAAEIFPNYSCTLFGVRFKHTHVAARVYSGTGGLNVESDGLVTMVNDHTVVKATMAFGRETAKGLLNDEGEFVQGAFNAKGKFVPA